VKCENYWRDDCLTFNCHMMILDIGYARGKLWMLRQCPYLVTMVNAFKRSQEFLSDSGVHVFLVCWTVPDSSVVFISVTSSTCSTRTVYSVYVCDSLLACHDGRPIPQHFSFLIQLASSLTAPLLHFSFTYSLIWSYGQLFFSTDVSLAPIRLMIHSPNTSS
jgi:hypothetical protein